MGSTGTQLPLDLDVCPTVAEMLARIRSESRDETEKGRWCKQLVMTLARQTPEWELGGIWHWADWPEREPVLTDATSASISLRSGPRESGPQFPTHLIHGRFVRAFFAERYEKAHLSGLTGPFHDVAFPIISDGA